MIAADAKYRARSTPAQRRKPDLIHSCADDSSALLSLVDVTDRGHGQNQYSSLFVGCATPSKIRRSTSGTRKHLVFGM